MFSSSPEKPKILPDALYAIGNTPLIRLNNIPKEYGIKCEMCKWIFVNYAWNLTFKFVTKFKVKISLRISLENFFMRKFNIKEQKLNVTEFSNKHFIKMKCSRFGHLQLIANCNSKKKKILIISSKIWQNYLISLIISNLEYIMLN